VLQRATKPAWPRTAQRGRGPVTAIHDTVAGSASGRRDGRIDATACLFVDPAVMRT